MVCIGLVGIGNAVLDVSGFTLLQRTVDKHMLGRVFGVLEMGVAAAVAVGSVLGSLEVTAIGIRPALIATGLFLPALAILTATRLRELDASSSVPERELNLLHGVPLFAPLAVTTVIASTSSQRDSGRRARRIAPQVTRSG